MSGSLEQSDLTAERPRAKNTEASTARVLRLVEAALRSIRFGQVTLTIHDGDVVQFDKQEKTRLR